MDTVILVLSTYCISNIDRYNQVGLVTGYITGYTRRFCELPPTQIEYYLL